MKILWIVNIVFPEAKALLGCSSDFRNSGGWMTALADSIIEQGDIELVMASVSQDVKTLTKLKGEKNTYYLLPYSKNYHKYCGSFTYIKSVEKPDVIHIHGTEFPIGLSYIEACSNEKVVVSIQGVISEIAKYYNYGLSKKQILSNITVRDILRSTLWGDQRSMAKRGELEKDVIRRVNHIVGRTTFDKAHVWALNPNAKYHFCNESLREEFYHGQWSADKCIPHSIFVSQAWYPVKGLHMVLKAITLLLHEYPDIKISVAGPDTTKRKTLFQKFRIGGYGNIIRNLIARNKLADHVRFTGPLNAEEMKNELLRSNIFVCCSTIENSSNSLAEAQMLGVPCVVSYVGGLMDMVEPYTNNIMYRYEDVEMLAYEIKTLFETANKLPNQQEMARRRHDRTSNAKRMIEIYNETLMT